MLQVHPLSLNFIMSLKNKGLYYSLSDEYLKRYVLGWPSQRPGWTLFHNVFHSFIRLKEAEF